MARQLCYLFFDGEHVALCGEDVLLTHPIDRVVRVEQQVKVLARLRQEERLLHDQFHKLYNNFTKKAGPFY